MNDYDVFISEVVIIEIRQTTNTEKLRKLLDAINKYNLIFYNEINTDKWEKIIRDAISNGCESVLFTGGEALLRNDSVYLMKVAHALGAKVTLFSNGLWNHLLIACIELLL